VRKTMSELEKNAQCKKTKVSKLAIVSLLVVLSGFFVGLSLMIFSNRHLFIANLGSMLFTLLLAAGFIIGIIANYRIYKSKGFLTGRAFSIIGTTLPLIIIVYFIIMTPPDRRYLAYRVICNANLRSLGVAMKIYASDYNNKYPAYDK
jgi:hypothetical protein